MAPLNSLVTEGLIERLHDPKVCWGGTDGKWCLKASTEKPLEGFRATADGLGVGAQQAKRRGRPIKLKKTDHVAAVEG